MSTYKLTVEYDGKRFSGWQRQQGQRTVQGVLEEALSTMLREEVNVRGASRTDAGVHAIGQVAGFESEKDVELAQLVRGLSALCRPDVAVVHAKVMPDGFNARFDSTGKHYRYRVLNRRAPSALNGNTAWHVPQDLDLDRMRAAAGDLVGTHDFAGFRSAGCERETTERTLSEVIVHREEDGVITITVKGTAFLKYMVRIIAGTLVGIGLGKLPADTVGRVFKTGDRQIAGQTAPAHGLTLVEVFY